MEGGNSVMNQHFQKMEALRVEREKAHEEGVPALKRLLPIAQRDTGQSGVVARFLLGLYNGNCFPFDLTDLRRLDTAVFMDCLLVLKMDNRLMKEVHCYFDNGNEIWQNLAIDWNVENVMRLREKARK